MKEYGEAALVVAIGLLVLWGVFAYLWDRIKEGLSSLIPTAVVNYLQEIWENTTTTEKVIISVVSIIIGTILAPVIGKVFAVLLALAFLASTLRGLAGLKGSSNSLENPDPPPRNNRPKPPKPPQPEFKREPYIGKLGG